VQPVVRSRGRLVLAANQLGDRDSKHLGNHRQVRDGWLRETVLPMPDDALMNTDHRSKIDLADVTLGSELLDAVMNGTVEELAFPSPSRALAFPFHHTTVDQWSTLGKCELHADLPARVKN
jgi:hypothetical protein